ncbi:cysteine hydrolase [Enterococcus thailandicus]|uniref:cysteine hydrolase family protein n=1 Tax=Enterococcus thailandicus TaxID=417368 RepID=UPI0022EBFFA8|nr:isochorismatase family cysteine hydrolase [Enterococcus thailandicus]MDA3972860.1 cysteine hydrolase [Enterococcus thailandicus]MDA3975706.1 cysteine hydrolase [Enterococcus thailandicus]MDA3980320.1 cysteine hydrolase [Enterococcus thailandicus]
MKALVSIDYTNDFVATDGKLTTGAAGQAIETAITAHTREFIEGNEYVVFAIDAHDSKDVFHPENRLFPPHNIIGTDGRELFGTLAPLYQKYQEQENIYWIDKRHYSAFSGTDLDIRLRERKITDLYLTGVCTDICVLHTAVDAYNLGYNLFIYKDAVASFDEMGHEWALRHFENTLGATIV